jgi:hypothetical protein
MQHAGHQPDSAQRAHPAQHDSAQMGGHGMSHEMTMVNLGGGWMAIGMAQAFPTGTIAAPSEDDTPLARKGLYLTQPALMLNVEAPGSSVSLRTTLNFEGITQPWGELTFGDWGEGFIDKRHPHTFLHEAMLSVNVWAKRGGGFSLSAGKGFAPYGTDDPMSRPVIKYPTNHHLSQILERFTVNAVYSHPSWSFEVGVFGGNEPTNVWDFSNIEGFANSFSPRVGKHFGSELMGTWPFELTGSFGYVKEEHQEGEPAALTRLYNVALRHEDDHGSGRMYALIEGSWSDLEDGDGYFSILGEGSITRGLHKPYARIEYATRPEFVRQDRRARPGFSATTTTQSRLAHALAHASRRLRYTATKLPSARVRTSKHSGIMFPSTAVALTRTRSTAGQALDAVGRVPGVSGRRAHAHGCVRRSRCDNADASNADAADCVRQPAQTLMTCTV